MQPIWTDRNARPPLRDRFAMVASFARELRSLGPANFLYSDVEALFAARELGIVGVLAEREVLRTHAAGSAGAQHIFHIGRTKLRGPALNGKTDDDAKRQLLSTVLAVAGDPDVNV